MQFRFDCTVVGDIFIDLIFHVGPNVEQFSFGGTNYSDLAKIEPGGAGNVAVGLSLLGGKAAFVGKAGNDLLGKSYIQDLKRNRVTPRVFIDRNSPTGLVLAAVHNKRERSFLVFRAANDQLSKSNIDDASDLMKRSEYVYFSGYSLVNEPQQSAILHISEMCKNHRQRILFDPGAYNIVRSKTQLFNRILNQCDIFTPNLEEALALTDTKNIDDAIGKLKGLCPLTVLKCGEKGCVLINEKTIMNIPGFKVKCIDPTGAGDAFAAALIYGLTHKLSLQATSQLANWFASQTVTGNGARCFPTKPKIQSFLKLQLTKRE